MACNFGGMPAPRGACFIDAGEACRRPFALTVAGERCTTIRRSNRYLPDCQHLGQQQPRPLLVTGTGRSGTFFLASVLQRLGLGVSHDTAANQQDRRKSSCSSQSSRSAPTTSTVGGFHHGAVSWPHAFRTCLPAYTFRRLSARHPGDVSNQQLHDQRLFRYVAHLVRTPLAAINSRFNNGSVRSRTYAVTSRCNLDLRLNPALSAWSRKLQLALQHWVLWNSFAEATSELPLSLERVDAAALRGLIERVETKRAPPSPHAIDAAIRAATLAAGGRNSARTVKLDRLTSMWKRVVQRLRSICPAVRPASARPSAGRYPAWVRLSGLAGRPCFRHRLTWKMLAKIDPKFAAMAQVMALRYNYTVASEDRLPTLRGCPQQRCFFRSRPGGLAVWSCRLVSPKHVAETCR